MKITEVEVIHLRMPAVAHEANGTQDAAVVLVHTDEGLTGIGEAESSPAVARRSRTSGETDDSKKAGRRKFYLVMSGLPAGSTIECGKAGKYFPARV